MRDIVLFLGAGFSADADLPVMSAFGEAARPKRFRLASLDREMTPELTAAAETYDRFRQSLINRGALDERQADNIETVFCVAEALREAGVPSLSVNGISMDLEVIVSQIRFWIWKVYHQLPFYNHRRQARLETYLDFLQQLKDSGLLGRVSVLTTNYDVVFEWTAHLTGVNCTYSLPSAREQTVGGGPQKFVSLEPSDRDAVPLFKLHGSINYFEPTRQDSSLLIATNISDGSKIAGRPYQPDIPAVVAVDALAQIRADCGGDPVAPAIVPPGFAKLLSREWLRETWRGALSALERANTILFVGYSMPPSDGLLSSMLVGSLGMRAERENRPTVFVIDRDVEVPARLARVFGENNVRPSSPMTLRNALEGQLKEFLAEMGEIGRQAGSDVSS